MSRMFANGLGAWDSIPGQVIPKTQKMVLDAALLNTHFSWISQLLIPTLHGSYHNQYCLFFFTENIMLQFSL